MYRLFQTLTFILRHPLNRTNKLAALRRYLSWQIGTRLLPGAVAVPFVDSTRLLTSPGMTGATGNVYCGLHEFEDMAFVLHALRPGDLFADVGANVGSYTVLAAGAAGAHCLSFEPHPATFASLLDNLRVNNLESLVSVLNIAVGSSTGTLTFTTTLDTVNHVIARGEIAVDTADIPVDTLDSIVKEPGVTLIKIDVEGFETAVLEGASATMQSPSLLAAVMELNGSGTRYGFDESKVHQRMLQWGFLPAQYAPFRRELTLRSSRNFASGNTLYVRDLEHIRERLRTAPRHVVLGMSL